VALPPAPRRVAVIGSGISGLTAAYVLEQSGARVTLFEKDDRLGGHADTHEVLDSRGRSQRVDTGFIVHNERTYPVLLRLFAELGVATQDSDMSMSVRCDECGLEYAGAKGAAGLFAVRQAADPRYLRMLGEVLRFHRRARALLRAPGGRDQLSAGDGRAVPGALPVRLPVPPRDAPRDRLPPVAHRRRRLPQLRREGREGDQRGAHLRGRGVGPQDR
jgi:phytoene dehydrogenase-like protein